jgi:hypothetical protein
MLREDFEPLIIDEESSCGAEEAEGLVKENAKGWRLNAKVRNGAYVEFGKKSGCDSGSRPAEISPRGASPHARGTHRSGP